MAQGGVQGVGLAGEAGALILDIDGNVGEGDLAGESAADGLLDPPDGVGGEARAAVGVEEVNGAQEANGAFLHEVVEGEAALLVAGGDGADEAVVGGDKGGAGSVAGTEGVLVEGPGGQVGEDVCAGVGGEGAWEEGTDDGGESVRGEREMRGQGGEDGAGGGASGCGGRQVTAQARGEVTLGQQAGAAAGTDRGGQGTLLVGREQGGDGGQSGGNERRGHRRSFVVRCLYAERTRPARALVVLCG